MRISIRLIDTAQSDNAYTLHDTYEIRRGGSSIGVFLVSHIDYGKFENELTSGRWVMRQRSYLWPLRRHLLSPSEIRARLTPSLSPFRGDCGVLSMIDDIIPDDENSLSRQDVHDLMQCARNALCGKSDFLCCLAWETQAERLSIKPLDLLVALGPYRGTAISSAFAVGRIPGKQHASISASNSVPALV